MQTSVIMRAMTWEYRPVDVEQIRREMKEGFERSLAEIQARTEQVERHWERSEEARRREWERLEGRLMTAEEKRKRFDDALLRKNTMMTQAFLAILDEGREEFRQEFAEGRAQMRANTEAVLKALDRLPPTDAASS
jgi:sugar-specific transcriptional regulator TrmB